MLTPDCSACGEGVAGGTEFQCRSCRTPMANQSDDALHCTQCTWSLSKDAAEADSAKVAQMLQMALHGIKQLKRGDEEACRYAEGVLEKTITGHRQVFHESSRKHADAHVCAADAWCSVHPRKSVRHLSIALSLMLKHHFTAGEQEVVCLHAKLALFHEAAGELEEARMVAQVALDGLDLVGRNVIDYPTIHELERVVAGHEMI